VSGPKQPINRKIIYLILIAVVVLGAAGVVVLMVNDPRQQDMADEEKRRAEEVSRLPAGSERAGRQTVEELRQETERRVATSGPEEDPDRIAFEEYMRNGGANRPSAPAGAPQLDEQLLRDLEEAERMVGVSPDLGRATGGLMPLPPMGQGGGGSYGGGMQAEPKTARYEKYEREDSGLLGMGGSNQDEAAVAKALQPAEPASDRIINQGVGIPAVLMSRIDTRLQGPITARVMRTVYDSRSHHVPLIPQGSRLVGRYESGISGGDDRVQVVMERLILPDGRSIQLPQFPTSGGDGTIGVSGNYKSNIRRAIGPTFLVAVIGQVVDRAINRELPSADPAGMSITPPPPSVLQQTIPKVNEAIMRRSEGATPYIVVEPGQEIRVVLTDDIEIPKAGGRG